MKTQSTFLIILLLAFFNQIAISQSSIDLNFSPQTTNTTVGSTITISLNATDLANILAMQVDIEWNNDYLEIQLPITNINPIFSSTNLQTNLVNPGLLATQWLDPNNTQTLSGALFDISFIVLQEGTSQISIQNSGTSPIFATTQGQPSVSTDMATVIATADSGALSINCSPDINVVTPVGSDHTIVNWDIPTATTTCPSGSNINISQTNGPATGSSFPIGEHTISYSFTDDCGNTATCSFNIVVTAIDMGEFILVCPTDQLITLQASQLSIPVIWDTPVTLSTCSISTDVTLTQTEGAPSGALFTIGDYMISYEASDLCGNASNCSFNIQVTQENTTPCPSSIVGFSKIGEFQNHGYYLSDHSSTWQNAQTEALANAGYLASIGNQIENDFLQSGIDEMVFIGLSDETTENQLIWDSGEDLSFTNYSNCSWCGSNTATNDYGVFLPWDGTWAFDNIWVRRNFILERVCSTTPTTELTLNCPTDINLILEEHQTTVSAAWNVPTAMTTCQNNSTTITQTAGPTSGSDFPQGTHIISYTATDECDNTETCSFTITITGSTMDCPTEIAGFTKLGELNNHAYFVSESVMTWAQAHNVAAAGNGYIATITAQEENQFLQNHITEMVFIGLSDAQDEGQLVWDNNDPVSYTNYSNCSWCGQNTASNDYGVLLPWDGTWAFDNVWVQRKFIMEMECGASNNGHLTLFCQSNDVTLNIPVGQTQIEHVWEAAIPFSTCPNTAQVNVLQTSGPSSGSLLNAGSYTITYEGTDACGNTASCSFTITVIGQSTGCGDIAGYSMLAQNNGHGYYLSDVTKTWEAANQAAQAEGGYLAAMNTQAENDFLKNHLNNNMVFIGYNDAQSEGNGSWSNGEPVTLDLSYNNASDNDYAVMNFWAGTWDMYNEQVLKRYVLEKNCASSPPPVLVTNSPNNQFLLSPNPTADLLTLRINSMIAYDAIIRIFSPSGKQIYFAKEVVSTGVSTIEIPVAQLTQGIYFMKIEGPSSLEILKFVKK